MRINPGAEQGFAGMCRIVLKAIRQCLQGTCWRRAFIEDGLVGHDSAVRHYILNELGLEHAPALVPFLPTVDEFSRVCPSGRPVHGPEALATQPLADGGFSADSPPGSPVVEAGNESSASSGYVLSDGEPLTDSSSQIDDDISDAAFDDDDDPDGGPPPAPGGLAIPTCRMNYKGPPR